MSKSLANTFTKGCCKSKSLFNFDNRFGEGTGGTGRSITQFITDTQNEQNTGPVSISPEGIPDPLILGTIVALDFLQAADTAQLGLINFETNMIFPNSGFDLELKAQTVGNAVKVLGSDFSVGDANTMDMPNLTSLLSFELIIKDKVPLIGWISPSGLLAVDNDARGLTFNWVLESPPATFNLITGFTGWTQDRDADGSNVERFVFWERAAPSGGTSGQRFVRAMAATELNAADIDSLYATEIHSADYAGSSDNLTVFTDDDLIFEVGDTVGGGGNEIHNVRGEVTYSVRDDETHRIGTGAGDFKFLVDLETNPTKNFIELNESGEVLNLFANEEINIETCDATSNLNIDAADLLTVSSVDLMTFLSGDGISFTSTMDTVITSGGDIDLVPTGVVCISGSSTLLVDLIQDKGGADITLDSVGDIVLDPGGDVCVTAGNILKVDCIEDKAGGDIKITADDSIILTPGASPEIVCIGGSSILEVDTIRDKGNDGNLIISPGLDIVLNPTGGDIFVFPGDILRVNDITSYLFSDLRIDSVGDIVLDPTGDVCITAGDTLQVDFIENKGPLGLSITSTGANDITLTPGGILCVAGSSTLEVDTIRDKGNDGNLTINAGGDITLNPTGGDVFIGAGDTLHIDTITDSGGGSISITPTADLILNPGGGDVYIGPIGGGGDTLHIDTIMDNGGGDLLLNPGTNVCIDPTSQLEVNTITTKAGSTLTLDPDGAADVIVEAASRLVACNTANDVLANKLQVDFVTYPMSSNIAAVPADGDVLTYAAGTMDVEWRTPPGAGGGNSLGAAYILGKTITLLPPAGPLLGDVEIIDPEAYGAFPILIPSLFEVRNAALVNYFSITKRSGAGSSIPEVTIGTGTTLPSGGPGSSKVMTSTSPTDVYIYGNLNVSGGIDPSGIQFEPRHAGSLPLPNPASTWDDPISGTWTGTTDYTLWMEDMTAGAFPVTSKPRLIFGHTVTGDQFGKRNAIPVMTTETTTGLANGGVTPYNDCITVIRNDAVNHNELEVTTAKIDTSGNLVVTGLITATTGATKIDLVPITPALLMNSVQVLTVRQPDILAEPAFVLPIVATGTLVDVDTNFAALTASFNALVTSYNTLLTELRTHGIIGP